MKQKKFNVWFSDGTGIEQYAMGMKQAYILACAKRINDAKSIELDSIEDEEGKHWSLMANLVFAEAFDSFLFK